MPVFSGTLLLLLSSLAWGQGGYQVGVTQGIAVQSNGVGYVQVLPLASIRVCQDGATGTPCAPAATIYTDRTLGTPLGSNVVISDTGGNYAWFAPPGWYQEQISAPGQTTLTRPVLITPDGGSTNSSGTGLFLKQTSPTILAPAITGGGSWAGSPLFPNGIQGTAGQTLALPSSADTLAAATNTLTFTNKTFDTLGAGNSFKIAGNLINSFSGSGAIVALTVGPAISGAALTTPTVGGGSTLNGVFRVTTSALNFGTIIAQNEADLTFTVTGAATSGTAWCSPTTNLSNGIFVWDAFVSSTNNVTLRVNNVSAGNSAPATVPWNCAVIQ